jgi:hypothetical protein
LKKEKITPFFSLTMKGRHHGGSSLSKPPFQQYQAKTSLDEHQCYATTIDK